MLTRRDMLLGASAGLILPDSARAIGLRRALNQCQIGGDEEKVAAPSNNLLAIYGDSRVANSTFAGGSYFQPEGFAGWATMFSGNVVDIPMSACYGVGGDTTAMMLARIAAVIADPARSVAMLCGTNDVVQDVPLETTKANIVTLLRRLIAGGKQRVYLLSEMPRGDQSIAYTKILFDLHDWIMRTIPTLFGRSVVVVNCFDQLVNFQSNVLAPIPNSTIDNLHQAPLGGYHQGLALGAAIASNHGSTTDLSNPPATNSDADNLFQNAFLAGTGGTLGGGATGVVADNCTLTGVSGVTVTGAKVASNVQGEEVQQITFSGTPSAAGTITFARTGTISGAIVAGQKVRLSSRIGVAVGMAGVTHCGPQCILNGSSQTARFFQSSASKPMPPVTWGGRCMTPVLIAGAGVTTIAGSFCIIRVEAGVPCSGTVWVSRPKIWKPA